MNAESKHSGPSTTPKLCTSRRNILKNDTTQREVRSRRWLQFGMRRMLVALTLCSVGCWWVMWPALTARQFVHLSHNTSASVLRFMPPQSSFHSVIPFVEMVQDETTPITLTFRKRSLKDVWYGRCVCMATGEGGIYRFWVTRGKVVYGPQPVYYYGGTEFILDVF